MFDYPQQWIGITSLAKAPACLGIALNFSDRPELLATLALCAMGIMAILWIVLRRRERAAERKATEDAHMKFMVAAEISLDAFTIVESVRDKDGEINDFRLLYVNANTEKLMGKSREEMTGQLLCSVTPLKRGGPLFRRFCDVVKTGQPLREEFHISPESPVRARWLRTQVVRLGDGLAITSSDISEAKATQERYAQLAEFTESVFQNAPFSIVATDIKGMITAMNTAAEKLTGYTREELIGKAPLTLLHDERELLGKALSLDESANIERDGFNILTAETAVGEMKEQEWTLIRRDGGKIPINLAVRAVMSDSDEITGFVSIAFDITERRQMLEYVTHLATHDQLTGLTGRALLQDRVVHAVDQGRRYGTKVAVFMIDLDNFKRINDSLGHSAGDQILIEAARRLRRSVRSTDVVARVGGDEFVVVMPDITTLADVEQCAINLVSRLAPEIAIDDHLVHITASVGVCVYPDFASDAMHLMKRADSAMYMAKESGRNQYQIFSEHMLKETADRLMMEHALRHALANNELCLHYQPQVSLTTGAVTGMEALLRWTNPKLGNVSPAQFIPLAEETGMIVPIGEWVFFMACTEGKVLQDELGMDLTVSVNLSPRQFQQKNLVEMIETTLIRSRLPPGNLEIEITENMLMVNSIDTLDKLQQIRELGVRISIDDFGTGFSSFSYLLQYQVDRLKIDQSFVKKAVTDANAAAVVRTIIAMSHGLSMRVVAEGVETDEQLRFLLRRKCDEAQGYFIAKPVPGHEFCSVVRAYLSSVSLMQNV